LLVLAIAVSASGQPAIVATGDIPQADATSITAAAPELLALSRRYPDYFGSPWHRHGDILERSSLTGDWGGVRQDLVDKGIFFDVSMTQVFQSNVSGGRDTASGLRYSGSIDSWLNIDTDKLGLWPGGMLVVHGETALGNNGIGEDAGTLIPVGFDALMPVPDEPGYTALSELYYIQALTPEVMVAAGKMSIGSLADVNVFANSERTQFLNTGLVTNPVLAPFGPYTSLAVAVIWQPDKDNQFVLLPWLDTSGTVRTSGFDTLFNGETTWGGQYTRSYTIFDRPGNIRLLGAYTSKDSKEFSSDRRYLLDRIILNRPAIEASDNYMVAVNWDQYLFVAAVSLSLGWGLFARAGWAPEDRNAIDQFYSFGIGGKGCLIPGRDHDRWGVGWAGTHISDELRDVLQTLGTPVDDFEHAIEVFYNIELTPAMHLTLDAQYILNPVGAQVNDRFGSVADTDHAFVLGLRLQLDF
jgi:porin